MSELKTNRLTAEKYVDRCATAADAPSPEEASPDAKRPLENARPGRLSSGLGELGVREAADGSVDSSWQDRANCLGADPALFFPENGKNDRAAKNICKDCDVKAICLQIALDRNEGRGVWGGKSTDERRSILKRQKNAQHNKP